jgi:hypothetical protein
MSSLTRRKTGSAFASDAKACDDLLKALRRFEAWPGPARALPHRVSYYGSPAAWCAELARNNI